MGKNGKDGEGGGGRGKEGKREGIHIQDISTFANAIQYFIETDKKNLNNFRCLNNSSCRGMIVYKNFEV